MAAMCPIDACKKQRGMCLHDKLMLAMGVLFAVFAGAHWGLQLF
jgi:hypothetical protein